MASRLCSTYAKSAKIPIFTGNASPAATQAMRNWSPKCSSLDEKRRKHLQESEALKSERNRASKEIGAIKAKGGDIAEVSAR